LGVLLYCGISETKWNEIPVASGELACVSPVIGSKKDTTKENRVSVPAIKVIQDSGAFCDFTGDRLSFGDALERQRQHAIKYNYHDRIEFRASYDLLIDEKWGEDGIRRKERWNVEEAWQAVKETVNAARFLKKHYKDNCILSCQGVEANQYMACAEDIVPLLGNDDAIGLGGWCIIGKIRGRMLPIFRHTIVKLIPYLASKKVHRVHIWGVVFPIALGELLWLCNKHNIILSTDSAGPQMKPCFGEWGYGNWRKKDYSRPPTTIRGKERKRHLDETREWLLNLEETEYYKEPR